MLWILKTKMKSGFRNRLDGGPGCRMCTDSALFCSSEDWLKPLRVHVKNSLSQLLNYSPRKEADRTSLGQSRMARMCGHIEGHGYPDCNHMDGRKGSFTSIWGDAVSHATFSLMQGIWKRCRSC